MEAKVQNSMKKIRLIPRLDIKGPNVIKGVQLECLRVVGDPEEIATKYYQQGADELIYMDVVASLYGRNNLESVIEKTSKNSFIPLTVGGGVKSLDDIDRLLRVGADKVAINSHIIQHPRFINDAVEIFGSQCIVGSVEAKRVDNGHWTALYNNGREASGKDVLDWVLELQSRGIGEIVLTSVDKEGTENGYDLDLLRTISSSIKVPFVVSGGLGSLADIKQVINFENVDGIALARVLHYDTLSVPLIKQELNSSAKVSLENQ